MTELHLHNTLSRKKQLFSPINPEQIGFMRAGLLSMIKFM